VNRQVQIQERLKEISAEMAAMLEAEEGLTEEQETLYAQLETEADDLTTELAEIRAEAVNAERRQKADEIRAFAKQGTRLTGANKTGPRIGRVKANSDDDPKRGFKTLGHFALRCMESHANVRGDDMLMVAAGSGMSQGITAEGGVLVPPAFSKQIWDEVLRQSNSLLSMCFSVPVDAGAESITIPAIAESSRANGSRYGGIQGYWKDELDAMTESKPTFRQVKLTPHELYVFAYISDKLLRQSPSTASALLERAAADEIAFKIGDSVINGTGAGQPRGIVGHAGTKSVAKETGQAAATVVKANLFKMRNAMHANWRAGAVWLINPEVEVALQELTFPVGTGGIPAFLPPGGLSESPYSMLFGQSMIPIEYCAALGTVGDIIYCNLRAYATAVRGMVDSAYSMHLKFDYAQTAFRMIFELDGQPFLNSVITPYKGSTTTSPIVTLATRG
jgi:HK97 family phage major capsid protein